jgi:hypothetical protein
VNKTLQRGPQVIRIAITPAAFDAIAKTLPLGSTAFEPALDERGQKAGLARAFSRQQTARPARPR